MSETPIEMVSADILLGSQPEARLLTTLVTEGPVRVELVVLRAQRGWALEATGWLDDEDPAWPVRLETGGVCADRAALEAALTDLLASAFHHGAAVMRVQGRPWAVRCLGRAAVRASERRYQRLPEPARVAPWMRPAPLGADPPREGVRIKTWQSRLRALAGEPERGSAPVSMA